MLGVPDFGGENRRNVLALWREIMEHSDPLMWNFAGGEEGTKFDRFRPKTHGNPFA